MMENPVAMVREKVVPIRTLGHFIDGSLVVGTSERWGDIFNPATGAVAGRVALASAEETRAAIHAARIALPSWAEIAPVQRARVFFRFKALLEKHTEELARMITLEHGKVLSDARGEIARGIEVVEFA